jgi:replicative superfamily II helicase
MMDCFQWRACWFQIKVAQPLYAEKHIIGCVVTGSGKTLSFWIALLMAVEDGFDKMVFIVTLLNLLGKQNEDVLRRVGIDVVAVSRENVSDGLFKVSMLHVFNFYVNDCLISQQS